MLSRATPDQSLITALVALGLLCAGTPVDVAQLYATLVTQTWCKSSHSCCNNHAVDRHMAARSSTGNQARNWSEIAHDRWEACRSLFKPPTVELNLVVHHMFNPGLPQQSFNTVLEEYQQLGSIWEVTSICRRHRRFAAAWRVTASWNNRLRCCPSALAWSVQ